MYRIFLCAVVLVFLPRSTLEQTIRPMAPYIAVEDRNLRDFANFLIQAYLLYSDADIDAGAAPSFIFISGENYISNGKIDKSIAKRFFPGMSDEEIEYFQGKSDVCLIFTIPLKELDLIVGINSVNDTELESNHICLLDLISYYLDKDSTGDRSSRNIKEYGRSIISELQRRY